MGFSFAASPRPSLSVRCVDFLAVSASEAIWGRRRNKIKLEHFKDAASGRDCILEPPDSLEKGLGTSKFGSEDPTKSQRAQGRNRHPISL